MDDDMDGTITLPAGGLDFSHSKSSNSFTLDANGNVTKK
jgi:hypothetical protein